MCRCVINKTDSMPCCFSCFWMFIFNFHALQLQCTYGLACVFFVMNCYVVFCEQWWMFPFSSFYWFSTCGLCFAEHIPCFHFSPYLYSLQLILKGACHTMWRHLSLLLLHSVFSSWKKTAKWYRCWSEGLLCFPTPLKNCNINSKLCELKELNNIISDYIGSCKKKKKIIFIKWVSVSKTMALAHCPCVTSYVHC